MDLRLTFGEDAANYDRMRPRYVPELFNDIIRYAGVKPDTKAIEVGIGTGQATEPFLRAGFQVTAVELSPDMVAFCGEKFKGYPNITVVNMPFEDFEGGGFDLIYSATAFHWIPREIGCPKAFSLLKSGGTLALFWNRAFVDREDDALHREIQRAYAEFWPEPDNGKKPVEYDTELFEGRKDAMLSSGFVDLEFKLYHGKRYFSAEGYVSLLNTYSDHRSLEPCKKRALEAAITEAVKRNGDSLTVYDTIDLYMARKA